MSERATVFQRTQLGVESTGARGTAVAAYKRLRCTSFEPTPVVPITPYRPMGFKYATTAVRQKEHTEAAVRGVLCYNDIVYLLSSLLCAPVIATPGGGTLSRTWTFTPSALSEDTVQSYTVESGSSAGAERFTYGMLNALTCRATREEVAVTGSAFGRALTEGITMTPGVNAVYTITSAATGGTFTLTKGANTTSAQAFNVPTATLQSQLEGLGSIGVGNVTVTGSAGTSYVITFIGTLADQAVTLTGNFASLTGGVGSLATTTTGSAVVDIGELPVDPDTVSIYAASTQGGLSSGQLLRCTEWEIAWNNRFSQQFTLDASQGSFSAHVERAPDFTSQIIIQHDSVSQGFMSDLRNKTEKWLRFVATGPLIEGSINYKIQVTFPFLFRDPARGDRQDVWSGTYNLIPVYDSSLASAVEVVVTNQLTAL